MTDDINNQDMNQNGRATARHDHRASKFHMRAETMDTSTNDPGFHIPAARHVLGLAGAIALPAVAWTHFVANAQLGLHDHGGAAGTLKHIVLDGSLAVPLVALAVLAFLVLLQPARRRMGAVAEATVLGGMSAVALALGSLAHGQIHPGLVTSGPLAHMATAFLTTLPVALLASLALVATGSTRARVTPVQGTVKRFALPGVALAGVVAAVMPLGAAAQAQVAAASPCPALAPVKTFDVQAINVDIPLNRFGDHDPLGRMYVLTKNLAAVREEERTRFVSLGLRDDAIQPLSIRANQGDCVVINYTNNATGGDFGLHINGLAYKVDSGQTVGANASTNVALGATKKITYYIPENVDLEGAKYMSPGPAFRSSINHGLFGALTVEPKGSTYFSQYSGLPLDSGWAAMVVPGAGFGPAFRENVKMAHEIGNESESVPDGKGGKLPFIDPITESYRPGARAYNYRSEPFYNRLALDHHEKSHSYSSYVFGDPATIIPMGYVGDPTKFRLVHAGSEVFHVYHLHGGGIRWRENPHADPNWNYATGSGLKKTDDGTKGSFRLDAQAYGPGESFNAEIEGGAGGTQQSPGDFLFHCHISEHYVSGMWGFWRVYDTKQPHLAPLPDKTPLPNPVPSDQLIGRTMQDGTVLTAANIDQWVRPQLPSQGVRLNEEDATVMDWTVDSTNPAAPKYLNEPEDTTPFVDYNWGVPGRPGALEVDGAFPTVNGRTQLLFNPTTGRPAFPMLRPHLLQRVPFSGNMHTGSPYLGETGPALTGTTPTTPGVNPWSPANSKYGLCPAGAPVKRFDITAITKPVQVTRKGATDLTGILFTLDQNKADLYANRKPSEPLAIRMNVGGCADVALTTEVPDSAAFGGFSKTNLHVHHLQFDPSGSDGVSAGFAFEHSVRPYQAEDPKLTAPVAVGDTVLHLSAVSKFRPGIAIGIGLATQGFDMRYITAVDPVALTVTVDQPASKAVAAGQWAGVEFVRYRWYADAMLDNIFWHDHVDGIHGWGHGAMGQIIIEPAGSTYHDPVTGAQVDSGNVVDIRTSSALAPGFVNGSFREAVLWTIDSNPVTDSTVNLKAEPFADRSGDPSLRFSSYAGGDPYTPLWRAYPGDPFVIRTINASPTVNSFRIQGHRFWEENAFRGTAGTKPISTPVNTVKYGVSERYTAILDGGAGGPLKQPGDYLYGSGVARRFRQGAWGIFRVLNGKCVTPSSTTTGCATANDVLQPLPGTVAPTAVNTAPKAAAAGRPPAVAATSPCPTGAPLRSVAISAVDVPTGKVDGQIRAAFVPTANAAAVKAGTLRPEPLTVHAAEGDCLKLTLKNERAAAAGRVGLDVGGQLTRTASSNGINVGWNGEQTVAAGATRDYLYYVDNGKAGTVLIQDSAADDSAKYGLYGAIVVAPKGATFFDPTTGAATSTGTQVEVRIAGTPGYRNAALFLSDDDPIIGSDFMPYPVKTAKAGLVNYMTAGLAENVYTGTPQTPIVKAYVGDPIRYSIISTPGNEQTHTLSLGGAMFARDMNLPGAEITSSFGLAPSQTKTFDVVGGAGGPGKMVGDAFYGDLRMVFTEGGMWGLTRVMSKAVCAAGDPKPLAGRTCLGTP